MTHKIPLRQRIREAGGLYQWFNSSLIRVAGPASVGPYDTTAPEPTGPAPCPICRAPMDSHTIDRTGPKPLLHCP
jgi:hypothetical protein